MSKKKFDISLTLAEFYAIRNALYEMGNNDELLAKINDESWHLPRGVRPVLGMWRCRK